MLSNNSITMIDTDKVSLDTKVKIDKIKEETQELYDIMKQAWDMRSLDGMEIKSKKEIQDFCSKAQVWMGQQIISCDKKLNTIKSTIECLPDCETLYEEQSAYGALRQYLKIYADEYNQLLNMSHQLALLDTQSTESCFSEACKDSPSSNYTSPTP